MDVEVRCFFYGFIAFNFFTKEPNVFASTILGSEKFIEWVKASWIGFQNADLRNVPVLKKLKRMSSLEEIEYAVKSIVNSEDPFYKKFCLYVSQQYGGYRLKEIGAYYHLRDSAVSQSNRRFKQEMEGNKKLKKRLGEIVKMVNVET